MQSLTDPSEEQESEGEGDNVGGLSEEKLVSGTMRYQTHSVSFENIDSIGISIKDYNNSDIPIEELLDHHEQSSASAKSSHFSQPQQRKPRRKSKKRDRFTLAPVNLFDKLFFGWGWRLLHLVNTTSDIMSLHLHLRSTESAKVVGDKLERAWNEELEQMKTQQQTPKQSPRLSKALWRAFRFQFLYLSLWKLMWTVFTWLASFFILQWLILFCEERVNSTPPAWKGHVLALALFLCAAISSICFHQLSIQSTRIGVQVNE